MRKSVKRAAVIGTVLAVTTGAGAAYAAWVANGTGQASAKAGVSQGVSGSTVTVDADLYPGATADAKISIANPNKFPVMVTKVAATGAGVVVSDAKGAGCTAATAAVTLAERTMTLYIAPESSKTVTLDDAVTMGDNTADDCQGATFAVPVSITASSTPKQ